MKLIPISALAICSCAFFAATLHGQGRQDGTQPADGDRPGAPARGERPMQDAALPMDPEMERAWREAAMPGPAHRNFDPLVGRFDVQQTIWFVAGAEPMRSTGVARYEWVLRDPQAERGRYLRQEFRSEMMGMPFQGLGYLGHDNIRRQYTSVWMDSMSTSTMTVTGRFDEDDGSFTFEGASQAPGGQEWKVRLVLRIQDRDKHTLEFFQSNDEVPEYKSMEIMYTRSRSATGQEPERDRIRGNDGRPQGR